MKFARKPVLFAFAICSVFGSFQTTQAKPSKSSAAQWVWRADKTNDEPIYLRHQFEITGDVKSASLYTTCDNRATVWVNGKAIGKVPDWQQPLSVAKAKSLLKKGRNQIAVKAQNKGGVAAFVFKLKVEMADGKNWEVVSGEDWKLSLEAADGWEKPGFDDSDWNAKLKTLGKLGVQPWGIPGEKAPGKAAEPDEFQIAEGFEAELLYTVPKGEQGSWVSLCVAPDGSFYATDQGGKGLFRIVVSDGGTVVTPLRVTEAGSDQILSGAQGLTWFQGSLWFHRNGGALYRVIDSNGDGLPDQAEKQPSNNGGGEHGNHAVIPDESGKQLYVVGGNHAPIPPQDSITRKRVQSWSEDHLLPRLWDARGHARGRLAPGGWISRYDPQSKTHDLHSIGMRNAYDIALNSAADLFIYDADMEWDVGSHWYRPTRINFSVSGSDYGWRSGTGKWPNYYEDSLPPVVEIGPGSPTGLLSGTGTKFPVKYQRALYAFDWTFGTIWAIHLKQEGAGYVGTRENFLSRSALPLTDAAVGKDGHLYFLVGGRGTQSAMYRVRYTGKESTEPAPALDPTKARQLARQLENFHGVVDSSAVEMAWPYLGSEDRFLRHAARVAVESQPVETWIERLNGVSSHQTMITACVALARSGSAEQQSLVFNTLGRIPFAGLPLSQKLGFLRALSLTFIRMDRPSEIQREMILNVLERELPADNADLNTELIRVLTYLQSPEVVAKTIALIKNRPETIVPDWAAIAARNPSYGASIKGFLDNPPPSREVYYVLMLSNVQNGWTLEQRKACIELLNEAGKGSGGASFPGFLANIRDLHLSQMSNEHRSALADISGESFNPVPDFEIKPPQGPGRQYTLESAGKHVKSLKGASFQNGRSLYFSVSCGACHRLGGLGGDIGPDLSSIPNKFDTSYVLEAIVNPNKDVSDQYSMFDILLADGTQKQGLYVRNGKDVSIYPAGHSGEPFLTTVDQVKSVKQTSNSQMPAGLINSLNPSELKDLMGYLMSGGDSKSRIYR
ncbi:MAG: c-type cytochrome [Akkermansiaceae bacterium]|jgi:putative heme-binding domain-containing protein|nr:c-type cytochrome [Akkermansiaceae bacterium]